MVEAARLTVRSGFDLTVLGLDPASFVGKTQDDGWARAAQLLAETGARVAGFRKGDSIPAVLAAAFGTSR